MPSSTTWQKEITVPDEGLWKAQIRANDTGGQSSLDTSDRNWIVYRDRAGAGRVDHLAQRGDPADDAADVHGRRPGEPITFTGTATDDEAITSIDVALVNNSTQEYLTTDGTLGATTGSTLYQITPANARTRRPSTGPTPRRTT